MEVGEMKAKRYYVTTQMIKHKFRKVGPFSRGPMGDGCNNWERDDLKVERKTAYGVTRLNILKNKNKIASFDITMSNPRREAEIKAFEAKLEEVVKAQQATTPVIQVSNEDVLTSKLIIYRALDTKIAQLNHLKLKVLSGDPLNAHDQETLKKLGLI